MRLIKIINYLKKYLKGGDSFGEHYLFLNENSEFEFLNSTKFTQYGFLSLESFNSIIQSFPQDYVLNIKIF